MFVGHYAPALIAATHPKAPGLGTLFVAGQLVDFGFFGLALFGIENFRITPGITVMNPLDLYHIPYTHSLLGSGLWVLAFGLLIYWVTKNRMGAVIGAAVVFSHWLLDLLVHGPDLTLFGAPPKFGFGLWNYPAIEMPLEFIISFGALAYFLKKIESISPRGKWPAGTMIALFAAFQAFDWFAPKPEEASAEFMISGLAAFTVAALAAAWFGRTRILREG